MRISYLSSDVCSSDLCQAGTGVRVGLARHGHSTSVVMRAVFEVFASPPISTPSGSVTVALPSMSGCDSVGIMSTGLPFGRSSNGNSADPKSEEWGKRVRVRVEHGGGQNNRKKK